MLVEHTFISTREAHSALRTAVDLLLHLGFQVTVTSATNVEARRGVKNPAKAKTISELPQHVRVEFDRGKITVGATVDEFRKAQPLHSRMLIALCEALEGAVGRGLTMTDATASWKAVFREIMEAAARRRRRNRVIVVILLLFIATLIGSMVLIAVNA